jgi:Flp pilus assembly protein TadD
MRKKPFTERPFGRGAPLYVPSVRPYTCLMPEQPSESLYGLYRRGVELLEDGSFSEATVPLAEAARQAPEKSSVREALGRAYFRDRQFEKAATEFEAVVETHPVNDYAHFCLGRALSLTGHIDRARHHLALASNLRPERRDYRIYRERLAAQAS